MSGLILISDNVKARLKPYHLGGKKGPSFPPISLSHQDSHSQTSLLSFCAHWGLGTQLRLLHGSTGHPQIIGHPQSIGHPTQHRTSIPMPAEPPVSPPGCSCGPRVLYLGTENGVGSYSLWKLKKWTSSTGECAKRMER